MELRVLKSWEDPSKPCDVRAHKTTSPARYPVKLRIESVERYIAALMLQAFIRGPKIAAPHEKENEPKRRLMDLFHHTSQMSQTSPGGAFRLPVGLAYTPRHRIGGVLRIGRLRRMATFGQARRDPFFQLFASKGRCCFIGVTAFLFWDLDSLDADA